METAVVIVDKLGIDVKIRAHINIQNHKNPEYEIGGKIADRAEPTTKNIKRGISNVFDDKLGKKGQLRDFQNVGLIIDISHYDLTNDNLDAIILQSWAKFGNYKERLKTLYFVHKNNAIELDDSLMNGSYEKYRNEVLKIRKGKK